MTETFTVEVPKGSKDAAMLLCQCALFGDLTGSGYALNQLKGLIARWEHARYNAEAHGILARVKPESRVTPIESLCSRGATRKTAYTWRQIGGCDSLKNINAK
jgi:hypothetical protein